MNRLKISLCFIALVVVIFSCDNQGENVNSQAVEEVSIDVAQTSGQVASGMNFNFSGGSKGHHKGFGPGPGVLNDLNLLAPTDELLAIVDAESASDVRGLRLSKNGGATITNYDADGNEVTIPFGSDKGPQGCSFSGGQFPQYDSLLATIAKTEIDFGSGVTYHKDTVEIIRAGKILIQRSVNGATVTETTTFENYTVNGIRIEGVKTRISSFDTETGSGSSATSVADGKITFTDGTVATWVSERSRVTDGTAGTVTTDVSTTVSANGTVIYSHNTTSPLVENLKCDGRRPGPVSGIVETIYRTDSISINFGDGTCTNKTITITVNGVTTTRTIGAVG
jgi:hypothetical protein